MSENTNILALFSYFHEILEPRIFSCDDKWHDSKLQNNTEVVKFKRPFFITSKNRRDRSLSSQFGWLIYRNLESCLLRRLTEDNE